jgi:hypothetical protein
MGCGQAWSAHGDIYWRNFVSFSGKLVWAGRWRDIREKGKRKGESSRGDELLI